MPYLTGKMGFYIKMATFWKCGKWKMWFRVRKSPWWQKLTSFWPSNWPKMDPFWGHFWQGFWQVLTSDGYSARGVQKCANWCKSRKFSLLNQFLTKRVQIWMATMLLKKTQNSQFRPKKGCFLRSKLASGAQWGPCTDPKLVIFRYFLEGKKCHFEWR